MSKIPKVIHYCWLSNDEKPEKIKRCMASWSEVMPDYEIRHWGMDSFDFDSVPFLKDAIAMKKWAYVSDFIRLYAVYTEGGIYLDSDVLVIKRFDDFLDNEMFIGTEMATDGAFSPEAAIFGARKEMPILKHISTSIKEPLNSEVVLRMMSTPGTEWTIFDENGNYQIAIAPAAFTHFLTPLGYRRINELQRLSNGVIVYPVPIFVNSTCTPTDETYAIHINAVSWLKPLYFSSEGRGPVFKFCKRFNLHKTYAVWCKIIESIRK